VPSKFPRAGRVDLDVEASADEDDDAPSRSYFWEARGAASSADTIPGVTRLSTARVRGPMPSFAGTLAEGTNPPRDPTKRSSTRDETAPLD
jgi:hypothetical protein